MESNTVAGQPISTPEPLVIKKPYAKPSLQPLGLLRDLTRFSF